MRTKLVLERFAYTPFGTYGYLKGPNIEFCTVELPWRNNEPRVSCIPEGDYALVPRRFYRGGYDTWEVVQVPERSHILIHVANWPDELAGCIGIGSYFTGRSGMWGVAKSQKAFYAFHSVLLSQSPVGMLVKWKSYGPPLGVESSAGV